MKRLLPLTLAMTSFFLLSCSDIPTNQNTNVVSGRGYEGILVADEAVATHFDGEGEMFQPTPNDVTLFEDMMGPDTLMKADPKEERMDWWRVYSGYEMDGDRHMYVQGNCETQPKELEEMPSDGICYWSTSVNLSTQEMQPVDFGEKA